MITQIISEYLKSHRRLNITGVGAFISKEEGGEILFSELLKKDDGVLRTILSNSGMREIEVAASIDRFAFEIRHFTDLADGEFRMEGFGTLKRNSGGKLTFIPSQEIPTEEIPAEEIPTEDVPTQDTLTQDTPMQDTPTQEIFSEETLTEDSPTKDRFIKEPQQEYIEPLQEITIEETPQQESPQLTSEQRAEVIERAKKTEESKTDNGVDTTENMRYTPEKIKELYLKPQSFREADPDVEDLTYSRRRKPLNGYTYVKSDKKQGVDKVLLFGIVAAVVAVAVIAYGYYVNNMEEIHSWFTTATETTTETTIEQ